MPRVKIKLADNITRVVFVETDATIGSTLGVDFKLPDGSIATVASLAALLNAAGSSTGTQAHRLLSGLPLGDDHPQYTRRDILTTRGDLYAQGATVLGRLGIGTANQLLHTDGTDPSWATFSPVVTLGTDLSGSATLTNLTSATLNATIVANSVTDSKLRQSAGVSIIGRSANTTGNVADITAGSNDTVLSRVSNALSFGQLTVGMFPAQVVTYAKIQNVSATSRILGRITAGAGTIEELTGTQATTLLNVFTSSLKGLVPASSGGTSNYLRADGTFTVPPGTTVGANPSASAGLTAVNGSATTYMRSDGAPALDVSISPTWTGTHTFSSTVTLGDGSHFIVVKGIGGSLSLRGTDNTTSTNNVYLSFQQQGGTENAWIGFGNSTPNFFLRNAITGGQLIFSHSGGSFSVADGVTPNITVDSATAQLFVPLKLPSYIVSGLPSAATLGAGTTAFVTDATLGISAGLGLTPIGGGSNKVPVYSDGSAWKIG